MKKIKPSSKETLFKRKKLTIWKKNNRFEKKILITKNKTPFTLNEKKKQTKPLFFKKENLQKHIEKQQLQKLWKGNQTLKQTSLWRNFETKL